MLVYNGIYSWEGWGGKLRLGSGKCRLSVFDISRDQQNIAILKPLIIVVSDIPSYEAGPNRMSVKSCASHIATRVVREFNIDPRRMIWVEHYPVEKNDKPLRYAKERFERVEFTWQDKDALAPLWKPLKPERERLIRELLASIPNESPENLKE